MPTTSRKRAGPRAERSAGGRKSASPATRRRISSRRESSGGSAGSPSPDFWRNFARRHWETSPLRIDASTAPCLTSPRAFFRALVAASEQARRDYFQGPLQLFIDNALLYGGVRPYLPVESDGSLEGYFARVGELLEGRRFAIRLREYAEFDPQSWFRIRDFLRPLFERVGIPASPTHAVLFVGDYATTPFGVHRDYHGTFVFVGAGRKRFRTWRPTAFGKSEPTGDIDYGARIGAAETLEGGPGDILYWPSDRWHVGEGEAGFSATLSIAVGSAVGLPVEVDSIVEPARRKGAHAAPSKRSAPVVRPSKIQQPARRVRAIAAEALRSLRRSVEGAPPRNAVAADWLRRATSLGIANVPPPLAWRTLNHGDRVTGDPRYPVVWLPAGPGSVICAANGHSFVIAAHPGILRMVRLLNRGRPGIVGELLTRYSGVIRVRGTEISATKEGVRDVLEKLVSLRAIS